MRRYAAWHDASAKGLGWVRHYPVPPRPPGPKPKMEDFQDRTVKRPAEAARTHMAVRKARLARLVAQLLAPADADVDALQAPALEMFRWQRLVVDELHELVRAIQPVACAAPGKATKDSRRIFHALGSLEADARWGLTA